MKVALAVIAISSSSRPSSAACTSARRNQMVTLDEQIKSNWAQVDVVLQRRADLIPNLGQHRKGFRRARRNRLRRYRQSARSTAEREDSRRQDRRQRPTRWRCSDDCSRMSENYPQLKSNENFLRLQDELAGTENRIAVERKRYNDSIQEYNTYIRQFPNSIFAGWAGFKPNNEYFQASASLARSSQG